MTVTQYMLAHPGHILAGAGASFVAFLIIVRILTEIRVRRCGGVRAPIIASNPFTSLPLFIRIARAQLNHHLLETFEAFFHGAPASSPHCVEVCWMGYRRFIMTDEPAQIKTVLTSKFADFGKGPDFHRMWEPFLGDSIFTTDGKAWQDNRSLIRPMFVKDRVKDLANFGKWTDVLLSKLPAPGVTVDIMDLFYRMTLDVTTEFLLGTSVNSLDNSKHHFAQAFNDVQRIQTFYTIMAPFETFMPRGEFHKAMAVIKQFIAPYIEQVLALPREDLDKLSHPEKGFTFLHAIARSTRDKKLIQDQLIAVLLAGRDTTAATLSWTFYELSRQPAMVKKIRTEILTTIGAKKAPSYEDLKNMPYITHCINETLRLYPAVPFNLRQALTDTTLPGQPGQPDISVLKGDVIAYSTLSMQRRKDLYPPSGPDLASPAVYSPERWERWSPRPWHYVPFNGGPRICVGQNFAMTEMAYTLVKVFQRYDRLEYRGDWSAQFMKAEIVGTPGQGVTVALFEPEELPPKTAF